MPPIRLGVANFEPRFRAPIRNPLPPKLEPLFLVLDLAKLVMRTSFRLTGGSHRFEFVNAGQFQVSGIAALEIRFQSPFRWVL